MVADKRLRKNTKYAAALKYQHGEAGAPEIVALGRGTVAEKIIALAKENQVPVHESPELAYALSNLRVGQEIPVELYQAVAEVLAFILLVDEKKN
ncbi:MAG: EscU/YscU/HrcU family type III secretion system export apparatus switch protein [Bacillota bacterium]|jgi:flagellar biosynthesis protein